MTSLHLNAQASNTVFPREDFEGLKQLWPPENSPIVTTFTIVFVHGLAGGCMTTWTHENGACWLDWLASKRPDAQIFSFGYDAQDVYLVSEASQGHSKGRTIAYAENLCIALYDTPDWLNKNLPVTFLGHGVGGLIIKNALVLASARPSVYGTILTRTNHVIFMDTPHRGLDTNVWKAVYGSCATTEAKAQLDLWHSSLVDLETYFIDICTNLSITSIYASNPVDTVEGPIHVVQEFSSALSAATEKRQILSGTSHVTMCKFANQDQNFSVILGRINAELRVNKSTGTHSRSQRATLDKIRCWLSAPDPSTNYHKAWKQRQADTGLWLLNSAQLKRWKEGEASRLWLYGIPGCGKTVLSSAIIEHLQQHCNDDVHKVTVYFYFDFKDSEKQEPELMLRSLLHQLLQRSPMRCEDVDALFLSCHNGQRQPSLHELLEVTPQVMRQFAHVYVILDALDECTHCSELMGLLDSMFGWKLDMIHLLLTSRKERDIEKSLGSHIKEDNIIGLQRAEVNVDISKYVRNRLQADQTLTKWNKDADIRQEIETALMRRAGGMFRWAACQLDMLGKCRNLAMLRKSLASLPPTLDQTYDRILTAISEADSVYAIRILQWLTFSERPLTAEEVAEVAAIDVEREPAFDRDEVLIDPLEALDICSSLITITGTAEKRRNRYGQLADQRIFALAHYSVQEYLMSDRIKQAPARKYHMQEVGSHEVIMRGCIGYLSQFQGLISRARFNTSAIAMYSAKYWDSHFKKAGDKTEELCRLAMSIFSLDSPVYLSWMRLCDPEQGCPTLERTLDGIAPPLYYAARLGLSKITELLLDQGVDVNAQGGWIGSALQVASHKGHTAVAQLLIDAGASVNSSDEFWVAPLYLASEYGHEAIVKLLIDAGADVNARSPFGLRDALRAAIGITHQSTVSLVLEGGAYCGLDEELSGPIHFAADIQWCTPSIVDLLIQHGASLDATDTNNMTPLHYCVKSGNQKIAKRLLDAGISIEIGVQRKSWPRNCDTSSLVDQADSNHPNSEPFTGGLTCLHFAALTGNLSMTKFLLDHGADPNALSEYGETPLHLNQRATLYGTEYADSWTDVELRVEYMLASKYFYGNHIHEDFSAAESARESILDVLLAHPNTSTALRDYRGESLLHCIRYGNPESVALVQRLLSRGEDPSCANLSQESPLHLASKAGDTASVGALISAGAKVLLADECGLNAIHYAARSGNLDTIIAVLETEDAKSDNLLLSKDKSGRNLLHHVGFEHSQSQIEMIQWLLDQGANITELDTLGIPPLASIIKRLTSPIDVKVFRLFLEYKENALFVNDDGQTLGHLCARSLDFGIRLLRVLGDYGVNLAKKDHDGRTVLHYAAMNGSVTVQSLDFLVNNIGIEAGEKDNFGRTALDYAVESVTNNDYSESESDGYSGSDSDGDINIDGDDDSGSGSDSGSCISDRWERTRDILSKYQADRMD